MQLRRAYTEHLGQLTCTALSPALPGMKGTDLGASFVQSSKVVFLFGDTASDDASLKDVDWSATAPLVREEGRMPALTWLAPLTPPGLPLGSFGVPTDGVAIGDDTYVFFATRFDSKTSRYATSAIAKTTGLALDRLALVDEAPAGDFVNVSVVVDGEEAFVFGSGAAWRRSPIRLARAPVERLSDRTRWRAVDDPVVAAHAAGEISARKHPRRSLYLLAFNGDDPRGVSLRMATRADGPFVDAGFLYETSDGYERFIHAKESAVGHDDGLSQPNDEETWGGEYGPYLVPSWFTEEGDALGIVFTLSSWNPYQVHLLRTWLVPPGVERARPVRGEGLAPPSIASDGTFTVDAATRALTFELRGRRGSVRLHRGADVVRCSRAPGFFRRRVARWNLEAYRGETLRLEVDRADARGFSFR